MSINHGTTMVGDNALVPALVPALAPTLGDGTTRLTASS